MNLYIVRAFIWIVKIRKKKKKWCKQNFHYHFIHITFCEIFIYINFFCEFDIYLRHTLHIRHENTILGITVKKRKKRFFIFVLDTFIFISRKSFVKKSS